MKYVRYQYQDTSSYGFLEGETIREISGGLFGLREETGIARKLQDVKLLCPCEPTKVLAIGLNYKSHLGDRTAPDKPAVFIIPPTALLEPGGQIRIPPDAEDTHYEGEQPLPRRRRIFSDSPAGMTSAKENGRRTIFSGGGPKAVIHSPRWVPA